MITFGSPQERLAAVLHEARMVECYGNWALSSRFRWPQTRDEWEHYQHHPHPAIAQAMAQAKAVIARHPELIAESRTVQTAA